MDPEVTKRQERLDVDAAKQTDPLLSPLQDTLGQIDAVFPGIANVERSGGVDLEEIRKLMPGRFVGPDAKIFEGRDIGDVPALPANILEILRMECTLANDGRTIAETHRLTLIPARIDSEPVTVNYLGRLATEGVSDTDPNSYEQGGSDIEAYANAPFEESIWVLEYESAAPGTSNENDAKRTLVVDEFNNHRIARIRERIGTMLIQGREHNEHRDDNFFGLCEERSASGNRVGACYENGIYYLAEVSDDVQDRSIGCAIVWKFAS